MKNLALASLTAVLLLSGCNTFKGFGQDVSQAGEAVTDTAGSVEQEIQQ